MDESKKQAFILMPFQNPYNSYYPEIFKPALEAAGYIVTRADDLFTPRPIMLDIQQSILEAHLILCEMSEKNPNVFYELGLAHAVGRPVILVSDKKENIPFDLSHVRIILYEPASVGWKEKLRTAITAAAKSVEGNNDVWPPPLMNQVQASPFLKGSWVLFHKLEGWKELHNLLQRLDIDFARFRNRAAALDDLKSSLMGRGGKTFSLDIQKEFYRDWRPCQNQMALLLNLAEDWKDINSSHDSLTQIASECMIEFDKNKNALEDSLKDCDRRNLIDLSSQFSDSVNHYLMIADDSLRRVVKKINDLNAGFWREGHR